MKFRILLGVLFTIFLTDSNAQCCISIDSISILPSNPAPSDSLFLYTKISTTNQGEFIAAVYKDNGNSIQVEACYFIGAATAPKTYIKTLNLGIRPSGIYTLDFTAYASIRRDSCSQSDSAKTNFGFEIDPAISMNENKSEPAIRVYPNPVLNNQFWIKSESPFKQLELLNGQGVVMLQQNVEPSYQHHCSMVDLPPGVYFLRVYSQKHDAASVHQLVVGP